MNPNHTDLEAVYSGPIPESASLSEMTVYACERELHGEVLERDQGNDAGLASKNGYQTFDFLVSLDATLFSLYLGLLRGRLRRQGRFGAWPIAALALLAAKVLYETLAGQTLFMVSSVAGPVVVPLAHLVGGAVGWLASGSVGRPGTRPLAVGRLGRAAGAGRARPAQPG